MFDLSSFTVTVSLSRVWFIDEMNPGNDYYSSSDQHMGNQKAPKIEKFTEPFWRKLGFFLVLTIKYSLLET